jgi:hypothetical protein
MKTGSTQIRMGEFLSFPRHEGKQKDVSWRALATVPDAVEIVGWS